MLAKRRSSLVAVSPSEIFCTYSVVDAEANQSTTCSDTFFDAMFRIMLCPGLSHFFVSQNFLPAPKMPTIPRPQRRSITAVILCCFSESNISLAVTFNHLNNKFASYICEAVECFGKDISRYSQFYHDVISKKAEIWILSGAPISAAQLIKDLTPRFKN